METEAAEANEEEDEDGSFWGGWILLVGQGFN